MNYTYWFGVMLIVFFVLYVFVDGIIRYINYVIETEND